MAAEFLGINTWFESVFRELIVYCSSSMNFYKSWTFWTFYSFLLVKNFVFYSFYRDFTVFAKLYNFYSLL